MSIIYPLSTPREKEILNVDWFPESYSLVRFPLSSKKSMFLRCIAFSTIEDFRKKSSDQNFLLESLKKEMIDFLKEKGKYSQSEVSQKLKKEVISRLNQKIEISLDEEEMKKFDELREKRGEVEIHIPESGNIFGSSFSFGEKHYPFFSNSPKEFGYQPDSNLFLLDEFKYIGDYMTRRIIYREVKNELQKTALQLEAEKVNCDYALDKAEDYKFVKNHLSLHNPYRIEKLIKTNENEKLSEIEGMSFSSILRMNICLLRAWSETVSVEKYFYLDENFPTLLIFYIPEGYVGAGSTYSDVKYFPGALYMKDRIRYYLDPVKDELIIFQLLRYDITNNSKILESNYLNQRKDEKTEIEVPEYGNLREILSDEGDVDEIGKIISSLRLT